MKRTKRKKLIWCLQLMSQKPFTSYMHTQCEIKITNLMAIYHLPALHKKLIASPQQLGLANDIGQEKSFWYSRACIPTEFTWKPYSTVCSGA